MKSHSLFFTALLSSVFSFGQIRQDWNAFAQRIDVSNYQGRKFHFQAAVKVNAGDPGAQGALWARIDKKDKKMGFFYNMADKPIRLNEWKVYSIDGKIDQGAEWLNIGGLYYRNGVFSFDDFRLDIENENGGWTPVSLLDPGFEENANDSNFAWKPFFKREGFTEKIATGNSFEGKSFFEITGKGFAETISYGDNPAAGKFAQVNGISLYYETYGSGAPLLLLHGNRSPINSFYKQIPALSKVFKVIAVDTRGQGKSTEDGKSYTYDLFAEDMNAFLNYLHLDSVNILGWSDGGNTGLIMAMKYPEKVKRLVAMGADVFIDNTVVDKWVFNEVKKQLKEFEKDTSYNSRNNWRLANLLITEPQHTFEELKAIQCPVLVMAGEKDIIKENHTRGIAAHIAGSTLLIAAKQTHYFPQENPELFNKTVIDFLEGKASFATKKP